MSDEITGEVSENEELDQTEMAKLLAKYNLDFFKLMNFMDEKSQRDEWASAKNIARGLLNLLDGATKPETVVENFRKSSRVAESKAAETKAEEVYQRMIGVMLDSGILDDPAALSKLGEKFSKFDKSVESIVEHHLSRAVAFVDSSMPATRHETQQEYNRLRAFLRQLAKMVEKVAPKVKLLKEDEFPPRGGKYSEVETFTPCRLYDYDWEISDEWSEENDPIEIPTGCRWWVIAQILGYQIFPTNGVVHYTDFQDWLKKEFGIDLNAKDASGTYGRGGNVTVTITKAN